MCGNREALLRRYNAIVVEHAERVTAFSELAEQCLSGREPEDSLDQAFEEIQASRQAAQVARRELKEHVCDHRCEQLSDVIE